MRLEHLLSGEVCIAFLRWQVKVPGFSAFGTHPLAGTSLLRRCLFFLREYLTPGAMPLLHGGLAQLARAPALQAGGQRFESVILHYAVGMLMGAANQR